MNQQAISFLGLCLKAGKLKTGFDSVKKTLPVAALLLFSADVSPKTKERMLFFSNAAGVRAADLTFASHDLHFALGKRAAVLAITDPGMAEAFLKKLSDPVL